MFDEPKYVRPTLRLKLGEKKTQTPEEAARLQEVYANKVRIRMWHMGIRQRVDKTPLQPPEGLEND